MKQAKYKKGQTVYYVIKSPYCPAVQWGEIVSVRAFRATHDYLYDIKDSAFFNDDPVFRAVEESEVYGTYEEAVQGAIAYCDFRIEDLKKERSRWEKKLTKDSLKEEK